MATVDEVRQQTAEQRAKINEAMQEQEAAEGKLQEARTMTASEKFRRKFSGLAGLRQRQNVSEQISRSQEALNTRRQMIDAYNTQVSEGEATLKNYDQARQDYMDYLRAKARNADPRTLSPGARTMYEKYLTGSEGYAEAAVYEIEKEIGTLDPTTKAQVYDEIQQNLGKVSNSQLTTNINDILGQRQREVIELPSIETVQAQSIEVAPKQNLYFSSVEPVDKGVIASLKNVEYTSKSPVARKAAEVGSQAAGAVIGLFEVVKNSPAIVKNLVTTNPAQTGSNLYFNFKKSGEEFGDLAREKPLGATGKVLGEIALLRGAGKAGEVATKGTYKALDLPKANTFLVSEEVATQGNSLFLKTAMDTEVRGLIKTNRYLSAAETQVKADIVNPDLFLSATRGVSRQQKVLGGFKEAKPFMSADSLLTAERTIQLSDNVGGLTVTREAKLGQAVGYSATKTGGRVVYTENLYFNLPGKDKSLLLGVSKPVKKVNDGLLFGNKQYLSGSETVAGIIRKAPEMPDKTLINRPQNLNKGMKSFTAYETAQATAKTAASTAAKAQVIEEAGEAAAKASRGVSSLRSDPSQLYSNVDVKPQQSLYFGKGTYEKTDDVAATIPSQRESVFLSNVQTPRPGQTQNSILNLREKQEDIQKARQNLFFGDRAGERVLQNALVKFRSAQRERQGLRQEQKIVQKQRPSSTARPRAGLGFGFGRSSNQEKSLSSSGEGLFTAYTLRSGKKVRLFSGGSVLNLVRRGKRAVQGDLAASLFIEDQKGEAQSLKAFTDNAFRPSKKFGFMRLIEKAKFRLNLFGEKRQIQNARKNRKDRLKWV